MSGPWDQRRWAGTEACDRPRSGLAPVVPAPDGGEPKFVQQGREMRASQVKGLGAGIDVMANKGLGPNLATQPGARLEHGDGMALGRQPTGSDQPGDPTTDHRNSMSLHVGSTSPTAGTTGRDIGPRPEGPTSPHSPAGPLEQNHLAVEDVEPVRQRRARSQGLACSNSRPSCTNTASWPKSADSMAPTGT